jgi:uncharacterized protein
MFEEQLILRNNNRNVEGILSYPDEAPCGRSAALFPPHPKLGGDIDNNILRAVAECLVTKGFLVGRFNYRGVGKSEMEVEGVPLFDYWNRLDEKTDFNNVIADAKFTASEIMRIASTSSITLVGYSFGAMIASAISSGLAASSCILISPPFSFYDCSALSCFRGKTLFIIAENDFCVKEQEILSIIEKNGMDAVSKVIAGEDHFYRGTEDRICGLISDFVSSVV